MLIRLNFNTLTEALRKLWPHLLNELISVFEIKLETMDKENTDLTIEAIKLVELLSSLNIEDF
jgi:Mor family transcriptional regulator